MRSLYDSSQLEELAHICGQRMEHRQPAEPELWANISKYQLLLNHPEMAIKALQIGSQYTPGDNALMMMDAILLLKEDLSSQAQTQFAELLDQEIDSDEWSDLEDLFRDILTLDWRDQILEKANNTSH